jgi:hypothetical protein
MSEEGVQVDPDKVDKFRQWPTSTNPEQVRSFQGFVGYYRKFIQNFAKIANPLTSWPQGRRQRANNCLLRGRGVQLKKREKAFEILKEKLITLPVLGYVDFSRPFELHIDACSTGLGAILYQKQNGPNRVIA